MFIKAYRGYKPKYNNYEGVNMRRKLLFILAPVFALAVLITLASCSDAYAGNYTEVTGEQLDAVETKLNNTQTESETAKNVNYEYNISATIKMNVSGRTMEATIKSRQLYEIVENGESASYYIKYEMNVKEDEGSLNIVAENWKLTDMMYFSGSMNGKAKGQTYNTSVKKKGTMEKMNALTDTDYIAIETMMRTYTEALSNMTGGVNFASAIELIGEAGVKVYTAGDNKVKIEYEEGDLKTTFFIIINNDNTFQMKVEMPETTMGGVFGGMTLKETMEIKPTTAKVTAPSGNFEEA